MSLRGFLLLLSLHRSPAASSRLVHALLLQLRETDLTYAIFFHYPFSFFFARYSRYKLRRAPEAWGVLNEDDGWRVFLFRPPWSRPQAPQDAYYALHPEKSTYRSSFPRAEPFVPTHGHAPSLMQRRNEEMEKPRSLSVIKHRGHSVDEATAKLGLPVKDHHSMHAASLSSASTSFGGHLQASTLEPSIKAGDAASVAAASASGLAALRSL